MWRAKTPTDDPLTVWDLCLQGIQDEGRQKVLTEAKPAAEEAHRAYMAAARRGHFWGINKDNFQLDGLEAAHTTWFYNQKLVGGNVKQRAVYERLKASALDDLCPFCNHRDVYDLDHYLPKESFHLLAVNPWNLVPSCKECNTNKKTHKASHAADEFFHPYLNTPSGRWLGATVHVGQRPVISFHVVAPDHWSEVVANRAMFQFSLLRLNKLYSAQTGAEIRVRASSLPGIYRDGGSEGAERVRRKLQELADEREAAGVNDWKLAMYTAMANSDWYCEGGFKLGAPQAARRT